MLSQMNKTCVWCPLLYCDKVTLFLPFIGYCEQRFQLDHRAYNNFMRFLCVYEFQDFCGHSPTSRLFWMHAVLCRYRFV